MRQHDESDAREMRRRARARGGRAAPSAARGCRALRRARHGRGASQAHRDCAHDSRCSRARAPSACRRSSALAASALFAVAIAGSVLYLRPSRERSIATGEIARAAPGLARRAVRLRRAARVERRAGGRLQQLGPEGDSAARGVHRRRVVRGGADSAGATPVRVRGRWNCLASRSRGAAGDRRGFRRAELRAHRRRPEDAMTQPPVRARVARVRTRLAARASCAGRATRCTSRCAHARCRSRADRQRARRWNSERAAGAEGARGREQARGWRAHSRRGAHARARARRRARRARPSSSDAEVIAGASALHAGIKPAALSNMRASRAHGSLTVALAVLSDLIARGVPGDTATTVISALTGAGAPDAELLRFQQGVERDIAQGATPSARRSACARRERVSRTHRHACGARPVHALSERSRATQAAIAAA